MQDYEKLGAFYLGRRVEPEGSATPDSGGLLLYDSRDLTTHAVCVGMTGSGKTGLCVSLLEEAAIDGVPALVIDPKGDLGNLLLTFPALDRASFEPWVNADEARREGLSVAEYATGQAELWRKGLASWDQSGERIARLRAAAEFAIYTPGSEAGRPISIVSSFGAPGPEVLADGDLLRERIGSTATSLLALLGMEADPIQSREHILLATLFDRMWRDGKSLDLAGLIQAVQSPPVDRVGVLDLETFYPARERFAFALRLNNLMAAPGFQAWLSGTPLDVGRLLYTESGRPRVAVVSIAHLSEAERMFFVTLLLTETVAWMRTRPGTTSLRAVLYMDEVFGYLPPVAEPPSKRPLLTLLKQGRAYGLGVVLATQNPVDLDYKGLSNAGTWFIGRLQTQRDKERLLDGLEGMASADGLTREQADRMISGLGKRVFLLHDVHETAPVLFKTRWAMSYLRGPLTRDQIRTLTAATRPEAASEPEAGSPAEPSRAPAAPAATAGRPVLPPGVPEAFLPGDGECYQPGVLGLASVQYIDRKTRRTLHEEEVALYCRLDDDPLEWGGAESLAVGERDLADHPTEGVAFAELAASASHAKSYSAWGRDLVDHLYRDRELELWRSRAFKVESEPLESEGEFRTRLADLAREARDAAVRELRKRHEGKVERLEERHRKACQALEREKEQAKGQRLSTAISLGATLLTALTGRKALTYSTISKASTVLRGAGRGAKEKQDVEHAEETVESIAGELEELNDELTQELSSLEERYDALAEELEPVSLRPRKSDVDLRRVVLAWRPE
jgi:hypothetical protein